MNEQQVNELLKALELQTKAQIDQTAAINRLAESNESLAAILYQYVAEDIENTTLDSPVPTYLSGKPRG
ncbi:hypothetical protein [Escherichia coli]|uniref:hypothetical protein n=1 Tax=Escherichia coli TaxID=562 RepID=UPI0007752BE8|nr:hypothetical protein [Escherichia coli]EEW3262233.1 hypothetical protein [Escherichia coli]EFJ2067205.1 hypothetical protein [Escherichia coli]EFK5480756.1 hypothetical protein [Escherichia coli]KXP43470.1 hypothetical protein AUQ30_20945 [Escherichia coli]MBF2832442.1 hypothetical protein [Escherichia coli]